MNESGTKKALMIVMVACAAVLLVGEARAKPLKVYIPAGQSNMEGQGVCRGHTEDA